MQKALAMWLMLAAGGGPTQPGAAPLQVVQSASGPVLQVVLGSQRHPSLDHFRADRKHPQSPFPGVGGIELPVIA